MKLTLDLAKQFSFLLLGAIFLYFSNGVISFAFATWMYSIFFLHISRNEKPIFSSVVIPVLFGVVCQISYWNFLSKDPGNLFFYMPFIMGLVMGFFFFIDRYFYKSISGFKKTLAFPLIYTSFEFISNLLSPIGSGMIGYSQLEFLSFSQLASITGMWGLTFMITWFGSTVQWAIDHQHKQKVVVKGLLMYVSILFSILMYGGIRLNIPLTSDRVAVSGIHAYDKNLKGLEMWESFEQGDSMGFRSVSNEVIDQLIALTSAQAQAGAQIIVWSEISYFALAQDEDEINQRLKQLAIDERIYLLTNPFILNAGAKHENKINMYAPTGELILEHFKYGGNFLEGTVEGNKKIQTVETPYGTLSSIICWDADFPSIVQQVGKSQADILLIPASDWKEITPFHSLAAVYRGIENGCSIVRQTRNGLSIMTDPRGQVITRMNHFDTQTWLMSGQIPSKRIWSLYPYIGDLFGWLSILGIFILSVSLRYKKDKTPI